jgi:flagellar motor switch protein FliM
LRQALSRAAERSIGLTMSVLGIRQDVAALDDILAGLEDDLMLMALSGSGAGPGSPIGFLGLDLQARAAMVEVQTLGHVGSATVPPRRPTTADRALADPFVGAFLRELVMETKGTVLEGWISAGRTDGHFPTAREAGLALPDGAFRIVRMTLDLGAGGRQGLIVLALPVPQPVPTPAPVAPAQGWSAALAGNVLSAQTEVRAVLHRMRLPLHMVEGFTLGQVLVLPGVGVSTVRVETPDRTLVGLARLGQMGGMRAVRLAEPGRPDMQDALPLAPVLPPG